MKKTISYALFLILVSCAELDTAQYFLNKNKYQNNCPGVKKHKNELLKLVIGRTLKCQIVNATSNLGCREDIINSVGEDGLACSNNNGGAILFFFDKKGVLARMTKIDP